jgi:L-lactate dehydrogenase (cytochrome)
VAATNDRRGPLHAAREMYAMLRAGGIRTDRLGTSPTIADIRLLAKHRLPKLAFDFIDGGAGSEITLRANVRDIERVVLQPRSLVDISRLDTSVELFGQRMPLPMFMSPCGLMRIAGGDGELAAVRAAGRAGITYTISTASSWSIEEIAEQATGPLWFQLYLWRSPRVVETLVTRAKEAGCSALVVTLDVPVNGKRPRDHRNGMSIPPKVTPRNAIQVARRPKWFLDLLRGPAIGFRNLQGIAEGSSAMSHQEYVNTQLVNPRASWDDVAALRAQWDGPLILKGVMSTEDATSARKAGADAVVVSNHGGRQLDSLASSVSTLPRILDEVGSAMPVLVDGGIRSGTDVVKVRAMGAAAAGIGRPWAWGVAAGGERGVERTLDILRDEVEEALCLVGQPQASSLDRSFVSYPPEWRGERA